MMSSSARWGPVDVKIYVYEKYKKPQFFDGVEIMTLRDLPFRWIRAHMLDFATGALLENLTDKGDENLSRLIGTNCHIAVEVTATKILS